MNKRTYIAPVVEEVNIETVEMMANSTLDVFIYEDETIDPEVSMTTGRRSVWGNRWAD